MDYLALVNRAILESGKDQDALTSSNFANPPRGRMYERFKEWVNEAYTQLQMARDEWQFKTSRATVNLYPAVYVESGDRATPPAFGYEYQGTETGLLFDVVQTITHEGLWSAGTAKATIYFDEMEGATFRLNEFYDENSPVPATDIFQAKGWGRYNFKEDGQVPDLLEVLPTSFMLQDSDPDSLGFSPIVYIDWDVWQHSAQYQAVDYGKPIAVTTAPDGSLEFYPRPDQQYQLQFSYTVDDATMTNWDDTPEVIPERYHMAIMWAAVIKSGMFDRDRAIVARATKEYTFYRDRMEKNLMPTMNFEPSRFDRP